MKPKKQAPIRCLLVDDHVIMREGLRSLLQREPAFDVVGDAGDTYLSPTIAAQVVADHPRHSRCAQRSGRPRLTSRERQVLELIAEGCPPDDALTIPRWPGARALRKPRFLRPIDLEACAILTQTPRYDPGRFFLVCAGARDPVMRSSRRADHRIHGRR